MTTAFEVLRAHAQQPSQKFKLNTIRGHPRPHQYLAPNCTPAGHWHFVRVTEALLHEVIKRWSQQKQTTQNWLRIKFFFNIICFNAYMASINPWQNEYPCSKQILIVKSETVKLVYITNFPFLPPKEMCTGFTRNPVKLLLQAEAMESNIRVQIIALLVTTV